MKPEKEKDIDITDDRLNSNQKLGLYYTKWTNRRAHIHLFNYEEHVFIYRTTKPSQQAAPAAVQHRSGPEMLETFTWNTPGNTWQSVNQLTGGFRDICNSLNTGQQYVTIFSCYATRPIDAERLVYLSVGKAEYEDWHIPSINRFFSIADSEINERITFAQNPCPVAMEKRKRYLLRYTRLEYSIITQAINLPENIRDLRNNCIIKYEKNQHSEHRNLNLYPGNGEGLPATGAYVGEYPEADAKRVLMNMIKLFKRSQLGKRVVVWYTDHQGSLIPLFNPKKPKINENTSKKKNSFR